MPGSNSAKEVAELWSYVLYALRKSARWRHEQGPRPQRVPDPPKGGRQADRRWTSAAEVAARRAAQGRGANVVSVRALHAPAPTCQPRNRRPACIIGSDVATTVKLDESRYLRLADAGKPGPGRLKRRTIQDMFIEALDEWFERRGL